MPHNGPIRNVRGLAKELHDNGKIEFVLSANEAKKLQKSIIRESKRQSFPVQVIRTVIDHLFYPKVADLLSFYLINRKCIETVEETGSAEQGKVVVTFSKNQQT